MERDQLGSAQGSEASGYDRRTFIGVGLGAAGALALGGLGGAASALAAPPRPPRRRAAHQGLDLGPVREGLVRPAAQLVDVRPDGGRHDVRHARQAGRPLERHADARDRLVGEGTPRPTPTSCARASTSTTASRSRRGRQVLVRAHAEGRRGPARRRHLRPGLDEHSIKVVDPYTVRFEPEVADGFFPSSSPSGTAASSSATRTSRQLGGTGPFKGISFKGGQGFQVERNDNYWQTACPTSTASPASR